MSFEDLLGEENPIVNEPPFQSEKPERKSPDNESVESVVSYEQVQKALLSFEVAIGRIHALLVRRFENRLNRMLNEDEVSSLSRVQRSLRGNAEKKDGFDRQNLFQELEKLHNIFSEFGRKRGTGVLSEDTANLTDLIRVFEAIEPRTETLRMSLHAISDQKDEMEQLNKILIALRTQARNIKIYLYNRRRLLER